MSGIEITPSTKVSELLDAYPELEETLIGIAPPFKKLGNPGQFPYTRGVYPEMYRKFPWAIRQTMGYGSGEVTAQRATDLLERAGRLGTWICEAG